MHETANRTDPAGGRQPALRLGRNCTGIGVFRAQSQREIGLGDGVRADSGLERGEVCPRPWKFELGALRGAVVDDVIAPRLPVNLLRNLAATASPYGAR